MIPRFDVDTFLKERGVYLNYTQEDLEQDLATASPSRTMACAARGGQDLLRAHQVGTLSVAPDGWTAGLICGHKVMLDSDLAELYQV